MKDWIILPKTENSNQPYSISILIFYCHCNKLPKLSDLTQSIFIIFHNCMADVWHRSTLLNWRCQQRSAPSWKCWGRTRRWLIQGGGRIQFPAAVGLRSHVLSWCPLRVFLVGPPTFLGTCLPFPIFKYISGGLSASHTLDLFSSFTHVNLLERTPAF